MASLQHRFKNASSTKVGFTTGMVYAVGRSKVTTKRVGSRRRTVVRTPIARAVKVGIATGIAHKAYQVDAGKKAKLAHERYKNAAGVR